jgi:hypothetical protein
MNRYLVIPALLGAALLASCDLSGSAVQAITGPASSARIKFHNFSPDAGGVNFFGNGTKLTAVASSACQAPATAADSTACTTTGEESTIGTTYGQVASGGLYDAVTPGEYTLTADLAGTSTVVSTATQTIADGKYYSFFMSGPYTDGANTDAFVVEDPIPTDFSGDAGYVRLVNAVSDGTGPLTLYVTNTETKVETVVGSSVAYKSAGTFAQVEPGTYTLAVRYTGVDGDVISRTSTVSVLTGHVYTVTAYGTTATSSTLALDFTQNQR